MSIIDSSDTNASYVKVRIALADRGFKHGAKKVAFINCRVLQSDRSETVPRVQRAITEWLSTTAEGHAALEECKGIFTLHDLEQFDCPQIQRLLNQEGVVDFSIEIREIAGEFNLDEPLNLVNAATARRDPQAVETVIPITNVQTGNQAQLHFRNGSLTKYVEQIDNSSSVIVDASYDENYLLFFGGVSKSGHFFSLPLQEEFECLDGCLIALEEYILKELPDVKWWAPQTLGW